MAVETLQRTKVTQKTEMRDAVFQRLFDLSEQDKSLVVITADHRANALNKWKEERASHYRDTGISEDAAVQIAGGMAHAGKTPFIYAISTFLVNRIAEQHKLQAGVMKLPYHTVAVGAGFSYNDSGPTHYSLDDIAIMRAIPNMEILSPSDSQMAADMAELAAHSNNPTYLRLDRDFLPILTKENEPLQQGYKEIVRGEGRCLVAAGFMVHRALEVAERLKVRGENPGVIDLYRIAPFNESLVETLRNYSQAASLEEHFLEGGIGSMLAEIITDNDLPLKLKRFGVAKSIGYPYEYQRDNIHKVLGLDADYIASKL